MQKAEAFGFYRSSFNKNEYQQVSLPLEKANHFGLIFAGKSLRLDIFRRYLTASPMSPNASQINYNIKINHPAIRNISNSQGFELIAHPCEPNQVTKEAQNNSLGSSENSDERSQLFSQAEDQIKLDRQIYEQFRIKLS